jgi:hypothetical protein
MPNYKIFQGVQLMQAMTQATIPTVKGWNRLEGRPRTKDFDETLRAEVRDALWMVTRQWQMGEFIADDAGSPAIAKVKIHSTRLDTLQLKDHPVESYDEDLPLETKTEQEPLPITLDLSLQINHYWCRLILTAFTNDELSRDYRDDFKLAYQLTMPSTAQQELEVYAHQSNWQWHAATANRSIDGARLIDAISKNNDILENINPAPSTSDTAKLNELKQTLLQWWQRQYAQPHQDKDAWSPSHLEYQAKVSAPQFNGDDEIVLTADEYHHGHLDWHSFDIHPDTNSLSEQNNGLNIESVVSDFIPTNIEFGGMPNTRWWEFEDRKTYFGDVNADTSDLSKLLLVEFGLTSANDWFLLPFEVPVGSLTQVEGLAITNVFGERIWIEPVEAGQSNNWDSWSMYRCNRRGMTFPDERFVFIPPVVNKLLQSKPVEKVNFIRDEMANMVWGIEQRLQLSNGEVYDGYEISSQRQNYRLAQTQSPLPVPDEQNEAKIRYEIMNSVPENWVPFIPVHLPASVNTNDGNREVQLQRAAMLRVLPGISEVEKIRPQGSILGHNFEGSYFVYEEEVPRAGTIVTRSFQRVRWHNGKVCTWLGRRKRTGRGEGNSGLAFDQIKPLENADE